MSLDGSPLGFGMCPIPARADSAAGTGATELRCLELFAGPGGLALGTHRAGFKHVALIEFEATAAETLRLNCKGPLQLDPAVVVEKDARDVDCGLFAGKVDLLTAGPPCQPFSRGGNGLGPGDPRNMFPALLESVAIILPKAILIENVYGLTSKSFARYFQYIRLRLQFPRLAPASKETWEQHLERLEHAEPSQFNEVEQYVVWFQLVDAADYGIPQRRHRVFILALRRDLGIDRFRLAATHSSHALLHEKWVTRAYWKRHGVAEGSSEDPRDARQMKKLSGTLLPPDGLLPWRTVRDAIGDLPAAVTRGEIGLIPNHVQHPGARAYAGHVGSKLDHPAKALKAGQHGTPGGENIVQLPENKVRYLTIREAARLQTFPDNWVFHGPWGACIRQLGNAVPVELAAQFAKEIHGRLIAISTSTTPPKSHANSRQEKLSASAYVHDGHFPELVNSVDPSVLQHSDGFGRRDY